MRPDRMRAARRLGGAAAEAGSVAGALGSSPTVGGAAVGSASGSLIPRPLPHFTTHHMPGRTADARLGRSTRRLRDRIGSG